ncbi:beta-1,4-galactosyltransferase 4-like [Pomacea canaliculata]|uniref:beta-1,4-galactosyltransferase 4-like n=1 Tax=Pomacea canaliculata TaxID=400727 RepID=UPI000D737C62|nr:beta-1,4-galactosyltransferase 4-like [Pomacea canaliculata]
MWKKGGSSAVGSWNILSAVFPLLKRSIRYVCVFFLLLCVAEALLSLAVYFGYNGGTYFRHIKWYKDGKISFSDFENAAGIRPQKSIFQTWFLQSDENKNLPPCPLIPPGLEGLLKVDEQVPSFQELNEKFSMLQPGGQHQPPECLAHQKVALIIPYRDRQVHLKIFLNNIHPFLQRQQLDYGIYVVEMKEGIEFNRALLFNVGFTEALKQDNYTCFIFHDVDLIPEDDRNLYRCTREPRHLSVAIDRMNYRLPYYSIFGGASALTKNQFMLVNGFSNVYFGWGGEDDDMSQRVKSRGMRIVRYKRDVARYKSMSHAREQPNPARMNLLHKAPTRFDSDGLSSLEYTKLAFELKRLYTWILIEVDKDAVIEKAKPVMPGRKKDAKKQGTNVS